MRLAWMFAFIVAAGSPLVSAQAASRSVPDCPMRESRFSIDGPLIDILLSERAKAVIDRHFPGTIAALPAMVSGTATPTFSSIISLRNVLGFLRRGDQTGLAALETDLNSLPVTRADQQTRCSRYDDDRPKLSSGTGFPRVLLFEKMTGFRDTPSVQAANAAFRDMAQRNGWALAVTDKGGAMHPSVLRQFDIVVWNNVSGDVLTTPQRRAFRKYIEDGGGYVGIHGSGGDPLYFWDWYVDTLIGARFIGHPSDPQFQTALVSLESHAGGIGQGLPPAWQISDEWYSFARSPRLAGAQVVATIDEGTYKPGADLLGNGSLAMGSDHPVAWTRCVQKGRAFYSAIGHRPETYTDPNYTRILEQAVQWASTKAACVGS